MGATLADGGVNPLTRERVVDAHSCQYALAVMATAGLYETSGDWLYDVGLPGKSGIGGGIVTVSPGKGGLGTFAPRLDAGRQQRQGPACRAFPVRTAGVEPVRVATRSLTAPVLSLGSAGGHSQREPLTPFQGAKQTPARYRDRGDRNAMSNRLLSGIDRIDGRHGCKWTLANRNTPS